MALSMADKLRQAAASRMAKTAATTTAILDDMVARSGQYSPFAPDQAGKFRSLQCS